MAKAATTEASANQDFAEHMDTYNAFLKFVKWGVIFNVALMLAMAISFFGFGTGMIMAIFLTIIMCVATFFVVGW